MSMPRFALAVLAGLLVVRTSAAQDLTAPPVPSDTVFLTPASEVPDANSYDAEAVGDCDCGSCSSCGCDKLFGFIAPSDDGFSDFISPITNPLFFEDPRAVTEFPLTTVRDLLENRLTVDLILRY